jgi:hypothetical protein
MAKRRFSNYTHNWENAPHLANFAMASIDPYMDEGAQDRAQAMGFRTFRIISNINQKRDDEILCPSSATLAVAKTSCSNCGLCDGKQGEGDTRKHIVEVVH